MSWPRPESAAAAQLDEAQQLQKAQVFAPAVAMEEKAAERRAQLEQPARALLPPAEHELKQHRARNFNNMVRSNPRRGKIRESHRTRISRRGTIFRKENLGAKYGTH